MKTRPAFRRIPRRDFIRTTTCVAAARAVGQMRLANPEAAGRAVRGVAK